MKSRLSTCHAITLFATLAIPVGLAAQSKHGDQHHHYQLIDMGTFGGPPSYIISDTQVLTSPGTLVGLADTSTPESQQYCFSPGDGFASHAFRWQDGMVTDLGTLSGGSSSQALWITSNG